LIGVAAAGAHSAFLRRLDALNDELVDPKLVKTLIAEYKAKHDKDIHVRALPDSKLDHSGLRGNAAYIHALSEVAGDGRTMKLPHVVAHELGHALSAKQKSLSSRTHAAGVITSAIGRMYAALKESPLGVWASSLLGISTLFEEWRASGYAKKVLAEHLSAEDAEKATRALNAAFGSYAASMVSQTATVAAVTRFLKSSK